MRNVNSIIKSFNERITDKKIIPPQEYLEAATMLNVLIGDEHDRLYALQQKIAEEKVKLLEQGKSVAAAKTYIEATEDYKEMLKQKAKIGQIEEWIRLAKIQSRMKLEEFNNY